MSCLIFVKNKIKLIHRMSLANIVVVILCHFIVNLVSSGSLAVFVVLLKPYFIVYK